MWVWFQVAEARPGFAETDSTCAPLLVEATLPRNGDLDVPPDVMPVVVHNNGCGSVPTATLTNDVTELPVAVTLEFPAAKVLRVVPAELLHPGTSYRVEVLETGERFFFTVGEGEPQVPSRAEVGGLFDIACGALTTLSVELTGTFPDADPAQRGLLYMTTTVDGGTPVEHGPVVYQGEPSVGFVASAIGGRQLCASLRFEGLTGEVAWETEPVCGVELVCPSDEDLEPADGCGCRTGGATGGLGLMVGALLAARRRRV